MDDKTKWRRAGEIRAAREDAEARLTIDDLIEHIFKLGTVKSDADRHRKNDARRDLKDQILPAMHSAIYAERQARAEMACAIDRLDHHLMNPKGSERSFSRAMVDAENTVLHGTDSPSDIFSPDAANYPTRREVVELIPDPSLKALHLVTGQVHAFRRGRIVCALLPGESLVTERVKRILLDYDLTGQKQFTIDCTIEGSAKKVLNASTYAIRQWAALVKVREPIRSLLEAVYPNDNSDTGKVAAVLVAIPFWKKYATTKINDSEQTPFWRFVRDAFEILQVPTKDPSRTIKNALTKYRDKPGN